MTLTRLQIDTLIDAASDRIEQIEDQIGTEVGLSPTVIADLMEAMTELTEARNALYAERDEEPTIFTEYEAQIEDEGAWRVVSFHEDGTKTVRENVDSADLPSNSRISGLGLDERA